MKLHSVSRTAFRNCGVDVCGPDVSLPLSSSSPPPPPPPPLLPPLPPPADPVGTTTAMGPCGAFAATVGAALIRAPSGLGSVALAVAPAALVPALAAAGVAAKTVADPAVVGTAPALLPLPTPPATLLLPTAAVAAGSVVVMAGTAARAAGSDGATLVTVPAPASTPLLDAAPGTNFAYGFTDADAGCAVTVAGVLTPALPLVARLDGGNDDASRAAELESSKLFPGR